MAALALFRRRCGKSVVESLTSPLQKMEGNPLSSVTLPRYHDEVILVRHFILPAIQLGLLIGIVLRQSDKTRHWIGVYFFAMLLFWPAIPIAFEGAIRLCYREEPCIASRLQAIIDINVREMNNLLALMKLWESRSFHKVNGYSTGEDTMTRLRSFLKAMESLDLTNKIYELEGLSSHLNIVTKRLIRSQVIAAMDLIPKDLFRSLYLYVVPVSED